MHNRGGPPSLRRASSITRNPPRIQLLRCNLLLTFFRERREGGGNKVPFILPTFEGRSASESGKRNLPLPSLPLSICFQIDFKAASIIRRAMSRQRERALHSTRKINKDRKGTNFSWMGYQYEGGCMARSLVHTSNKIGNIHVQTINNNMPVAAEADWEPM